MRLEWVCGITQCPTVTTLFFEVGADICDECPVMIVTHERLRVGRSCDCGAEADCLRNAEYEETM